MVELCPICCRELGDENIDEHHLVPKTFGGKQKFPLHRVCHQKLHSVFTEREMLNKYHTWDLLREHPEIQKFAVWIRKKPLGFYDSSKDHAVRRNKRKS